VFGESFWMGAKFRTKLAASWLLAGALLFLAGCAPVLQPETAAQQPTFFRPPAPARPDTPEAALPAAAEAADLPTPAVRCTDNLTFLSDLTIPDGTIVSPGSTLDKRWEVENSGNCNWSANYRIRLTAGPDLSAQTEQALYPARAGTRAVIRILFKAPAEPGTYRSAWQAFDEQGEPFGDPFFIEITVE